MNRDDQLMTGFFYRIAEKAAKNGLVVDFHGAAPPPGLSAEYPNVLTGEGVKGLEHNKFSDRCTPDNDVYIPFLRMFSGAVRLYAGCDEKLQPEGTSMCHTIIPLQLAHGFIRWHCTRCSKVRFPSWLTARRDTAGRMNVRASFPQFP
jgi:hypothetical protein